MKKLFLILSVLLNVILLSVCIYQMSRPLGRIYTDSSVNTYFQLQQKLPVNSEDIVFMGGQQIANCDWYELLDNCKIKNRGIPGAQIIRDTDRLDKILKNGPAQVFLLYGIDELNAGVSVETVVEQYKNFVNFILANSPMTEILIQSVFPVAKEQQRIKVRNEDIEEFNMEMKEFALENGIVYIDLYSDFLNEEKDGIRISYTVGDGYLLSATGYTLWKDRIQSFIKK
jgi:lysophospholipase L1-like esterase